MLNTHTFASWSQALLCSMLFSSSIIRVLQVRCSELDECWLCTTPCMLCAGISVVVCYKQLPPRRTHATTHINTANTGDRLENHAMNARASRPDHPHSPTSCYAPLLCWHSDCFTARTTLKATQRLHRKCNTHEHTRTHTHTRTRSHATAP